MTARDTFQKPSEELGPISAIPLACGVLLNMIQSEKVIDNHWREAAAASFVDIANALRDGVSPSAIAEICDGVARAIRSPEDHDQIQAELATSIEGDLQ